MTAIDQIRKELDAATPGPWEVATGPKLGWVAQINDLWVVHDVEEAGPVEADATLIAHAPTYLAALCDVAEAAQAMVDAIDEKPSLEWIAYASSLNDALGKIPQVCSEDEL